MSELLGDLSGICRVNFHNPTTSSLSWTTTWMQFVGNVGFLQQENILETFGLE